MRDFFKLKQDTLKGYFKINLYIHKDILVLKNFLKPQDIYYILQDHDSCNEWKEVRAEDEKKRVNTAKIFFVKDKNVDKFIFLKIKDILSIYSIFYPEINILIDGDQGYRYNLYSKDESYYEHIDCSKIGPKLRQRLVSCIIQLNSNYEGGILHFPNQKLKIKLKAGDVVLFPSTHTHPHYVSSVTNGVRKNIVTWFI